MHFIYLLHSSGYMYQCKMLFMVASSHLFIQRLVISQNGVWREKWKQSTHFNLM